MKGEDCQILLNKTIHVSDKLKQILLQRHGDKVKTKKNPYDRMGGGG